MFNLRIKNIYFLYNKSDTNDVSRKTCHAKEKEMIEGEK